MPTTKNVSTKSTKTKITDSDITGKKIKVAPAPAAEVGMVTDGSFTSSLIDAAQVGRLDINAIGDLENKAQNREQLYQLIDAMSQDDIISSVVETYAEDVVETNDKGQVMWCESSDSNIAHYVSFLLDSLNIEKNMYSWAYSLLTYGDLYLRLYKESDYGDDPIFGSTSKPFNVLNESKDLKEDVNVRLYEANDHYVPYVERMPNPGEVFELTKFGKTVGYVHAPTRVIQQTTDNLYDYLTKYQMKKKDVEIYDATSFVHACLENTSSRTPETVDIFLEDPTDENKEGISTSYNVKRGQSILYNSFRIWREMSLLENSALLNRLTKSAVVRILNVDIGDMPREQVNAFMQRLKEKIEQKAAYRAGGGMTEYTNPGPIENTIYIPTHGTQGQITATTIGGDYDPKSLVDIEYFRDKLFGSLKVPKQYFGFTEDGAGFNGGQSLTILSSRYGKSVKRIQNTLCQMVTDIINLYLIDRGLTNYINKFTLMMQSPVTQEEVDKRTNNDNRIRFVNDVMNMLNDIDDKATKLKILKTMLSSVVNDPEVTGILQEYIATIEAEKSSSNDEDAEDDSFPDEAEEPMVSDEPVEESIEVPETETSVEEAENLLTEEGVNEAAEKEEDSYLPTPNELGKDMTEGSVKDIH